MSLAEIVQSSGYKNFMAKLYGIGASVVIVGALFKIQHWPLAGTMLLFLCFPVKMFIWIFIAAAVGSKLITLKPEQEPSANYSKQ